MLKTIFLSAVLAGLCGVASVAALPGDDEPFMWGIYGVGDSGDAEFQALADAGINYVQDYYKLPWTPEKRMEILDRAARHRMKVLFDIGGTKHIKQDDADYLDLIRANAMRVKDHPALGMWYLCDEPKTAWLPKVKKIRSMLSEFSDKPTALVIHWRESWENTRGYSDVWMADIYPVRGTEFPTAPLQQYTQFISSAAQCRVPGTPFIAVMQMCDFSCFKSLVKDEAARQTLRYPNFIEMRFMGLSSLTYGVRGLFFYSLHHAHRKRPSGLKFWNESFLPFMGEAKELTTLLHPAWQVTAQGFDFNRNHQVNFGYWERSSGKWMILTNNSPESRQLSVPVGRFENIPRDGALIPWGRTAARKATLAAGSLEVAAGPWESFVWRIQ